MADGEGAAQQKVFTSLVFTLALSAYGVTLVLPWGRWVALWMITGAKPSYSRSLPLDYQRHPRRAYENPPPLLYYF